jgi:hypothetical protein
MDAVMFYPLHVVISLDRPNITVTAKDRRCQAARRRSRPNVDTALIGIAQDPQGNIFKVTFTLTPPGS